jgi:glycerol-3-phosphate dehydrogenase
LNGLRALADGPPLDLVVIGGGINGAAIAREAAARGQRTALFEKDDLGFGTTWRSTRLIHGGLRYLEHGDIRLVFESLRERGWLLKTRPHLVEPLEMLLPVLPWTRRPAWQLRAGLAAYDILAFRGGLPRHHSLSAESLQELAPGLSPQAARGFSFFDARAIAPERLALELALEARELGAAIANHARVTAIGQQRGSVSGVRVEQDGVEYWIPARNVINAAGPWVDAVNALLAEGPAPLLGVTRGTHIVFEPALPLGSSAVFSTARSDGRVFFAIPRGPLLLVGTSDVRFDGDPGAVAPTQAEVAYLLAEAQELLPGLGLSVPMIRYAYAGLRPLPITRGGPEAAISRRHILVRHGDTDGPDGLFSVAGGKLSTFRPLAREALDVLGAPGRAQEWPPGPHWDRSWLARQGLNSRSQQALGVYGPAAPGVLELGVAVLCEHSGAVSGQVAWAVQREDARTLSDILMRRTGIAWASCRGLCCCEAAAALVRPLLGWTDAEAQAQLQAYRDDINANLPLPGDVAASA